jgi:hypothetical protein
VRPTDDPRAVVPTRAKASTFGDGVANPGPARTIGAHWPTSAPGLVVLTALAGAGLGAAATSPAPAVVLAEWAVLGAVGSGIPVCLAMYLLFVWSVRIDPEGVDFRHVGGTTRVLWRDLIPPPRRQLLVVGFLYRSNGVVNPSDLLAVSQGQARGILSDPNCPPFELDPWLAETLHLPAAGARPGPP